MHKIKKATIDSIIMAAKKVYPEEFFSMLGGENNIIKELVVVPAIYGENYSSYRLDMVPYDNTIIGTVHSHPNNSNEPSDADLLSFAKTGKVHLIIAYPYELNTIRAFDNKGRDIEIEVIE